MTRVRRLMAAVAAFSILAAPGVAAAQGLRGLDCPIPAEPAKRDGATLSREQIDAYGKEVRDYVTLTHDYERCVERWFKAQKEPSDGTKVRVERLLIRNEENRFRVADEFNTAADAYNRARGLDTGEKPKLGEGLTPVQ